MTLRTRQDELYDQAAEEFGPALTRLARSCEADPEKRRDLLQEIHLGLWRSFASFQSQCSLRTWVYRVAHNVVASHVIGSRRRGQAFVSLDQAAALEVGIDPHAALDRQRALDQLYVLIRQLDPLERQVILLYLEGFDGASIGEITGMSSINAATRIHRIKKLLARRFSKGDSNAF
jgi:RNA polymerase sigma-70 factor, ECF subfamily